jgi:hypothetical protein
MKPRDFVTEEAIDKIFPADDRTRQKAEREGRFPHRFRLHGKMALWYRDEVEAWLADPRAWSAKGGKAA